MDRAEAAFSSRLETAEKMIIDPQESRSKFSSEIVVAQFYNCP